MKLVLIFILTVLSSGHVVKRQAANDVFRDVVRQKTRGNQIQQCPCVIHPESKQCISYDSRYIAVSPEEAILSFLDLSKHRSSPAPLINSNTFSCTTQECQQCFSLLYHKLGTLGFIPSSYRSSITPLPQNQLNPSLCTRFNFPQPMFAPIPPVVVPAYLQSLIAAGKQFRNTITPPRPRSNQGSPPAAAPPNPPNNRNNNANQNSNNFPSSRNPNPNSNRNQNRNQNQNQNNVRNQNQQGRPNFNQNNQNQNNLQNQRMQFRNNQAMRNRFNAQQRANNAFQRPNFQRPNQFQQPRPQFQTQVQNPRAFQNINGVQQYWNGRFWEPVGHAVSEAIRNPIQNAVGNGWSNGWGGQQGNSGNGFPQAPPVPVQPVAPQPSPVWSGGAGDGFGGHIGWGGSGSGNQNNNGFGGLFAGFGGFKKRETRAATPAIIGQRFTINCMSRGDSEDDMLALCGSCWTWRQLPDNYFPRIINELSCKPDDYCLSGWGECVQQYRNVDVLRRDNGRWVPTVITTSTCCDCRVRAGTEIHSLVIGDKH